MSLTKITCPDHMYIPSFPSIRLSPRRAADVETRTRGRSPRVTPLVPIRRRVFVFPHEDLLRTGCMPITKAPVHRATTQMMTKRFRPSPRRRPTGCGGPRWRVHAVARLSVILDRYERRGSEPCSFSMKKALSAPSRSDGTGHSAMTNGYRHFEGPCSTIISAGVDSLKCKRLCFPSATPVIADKVKLYVS